MLNIFRKRFFTVKNRDSRTGWQKDKEAFMKDRASIASDWNKVCRDLNVAFDKVSEEIKC